MDEVSKPQQIPPVYLTREKDGETTELSVQGFVVGDQAYPLSRYMQTPITDRPREQLNRQERLYNYRIRYDISPTRNLPTFYSSHHLGNW